MPKKNRKIVDDNLILKDVYLGIEKKHELFIIKVVALILWQKAYLVLLLQYYVHVTSVIVSQK